MNILDVKSFKPYKILVEEGLLSKAGDIFLEYFQNRMEAGEYLYVVTDKNVARLYLKSFVKSLKKSGFKVKYKIFPHGERIKDFSFYKRLLIDMAKSGLSRDSVVIALGGGVIGDLSGFAASTYMRGVDFVQIPTTLLSQVDSSIGGKVGINLKEGKNLVGSFYSPRFVIIDFNLLKTLEPRELVAGFAEIIKAALIFNKSMFNKIYRKLKNCKKEDNKLDNEEFKKALLSDREFVEYVITAAIKVKREVVQADEYEKELRMILNFGHTFGHAIEKLTGYRKFLHGEAVIAGMKMATELSLLKGYLSESDYKRIMEILELFKLPSFSSLTSKKVFKQIGMDKKKRSGKVNYILLKEIGYGYPDEDVEKELVLKSIERVLKR